MNIKSVSITLHGRVQGVGFRYFVNSLARDLGVKGFVRNQPNRTVYIEAQGPVDTLEVFIHHSTRGPSHAYVSRFELSSIPFQGFDRFEVK